MSKDQTSQSRLVRSIEVEMTSEAITRRLREASELNQLGLSLAKAKRITPDPAPTVPEPTVIGHKEGARSEK
jgi:hypothetical protein